MAPNRVVGESEFAQRPLVHRWARAMAQAIENRRWMQTEGARRLLLTLAVGCLATPPLSVPSSEQLQCC